ncbi:secretion protein HlyD [Leptospira perolatii]|uniref:Secretion protein HlyD n=1 Tax=Leptospira perolatii TaxID=2023191 RepID=A0A2M9ZJH8_9LEPT|nr:HlyD family efflux transporter periplasmic adaptor subunit [Leptospira perolatii]PJZ68851.1 secretion protein HlyD [Leptospira perolatii]PJZ72182.1 secretion protein HlyD [Leptospira perolatii]
MKINEKIIQLLRIRSVQIGLGVFILVLFLWFIFRSNPVTSETGKVRIGTYEQIVEEEGYTQVKDKFTLYSPVNGVMKRITKHPGETVSKGETVVILEWDYERPIKSPIQGTILKILRISEGPVTMGTPLLEIGDTSKLEIVSEILTQEAVHIHSGDLVQIDGWGGGNLEGKIRLVEPSAFTKVSALGVEEQRVRVLIDFAPPHEMGEGFQVRCKIVASKKPNSIIVPTAALFRDGQDWAAFKVTKGKAYKTKVSIDSRSGADALVAEGLKEGDEVILYPSESIRDGVKIKK